MDNLSLPNQTLVSIKKINKADQQSIPVEFNQILLQYHNQSWNVVAEGKADVDIARLQTSEDDPKNYHIALFNRKVQSSNYYPGQIDLGVFDWIYKVRFDTVIKYQTQIHVSKLHNFLKVFSPNLTDIMTPVVQQNIASYVNLLVPKMIFDEMKNTQISIIELPSQLKKLMPLINSEINQRLLAYAYEVQIEFQNVTFVSTPILERFKQLMLKAAEMKLLKYTFKDEFLIDLIAWKKDEKKEQN
jgi:hypothetical protein